MGYTANAKNHVLKHGAEWVTSPFALRTDPITGKTQTEHNGIDLINGLIDVPPCSDTIVAAENGEIISVMNSVKGVDTQVNTAGNYVKIKHNEHTSTRYLHMEYGTVSVKIGDKIAKGTPIGFMGNTGYSAGVHLHFEIWRDGVRVDPLPYLQGAEDIDGKPITEKPPKDVENKPVSVSIAKGDKVTVHKNATAYGGGGLASWVYSKIFTVMEKPINDRVVIGFDGSITAAVSANDLSVVEIGIDLSPDTDKKPQAIAVGDRVKIKTGATTYGGSGLAVYVYANVYDVMQIGASGKPDYVVVGQGGQVTAAVKMADLIRV